MKKIRIMANALLAFSILTAGVSTVHGEEAESTAEDTGTAEVSETGGDSGDVAEEISGEENAEEAAAEELTAEPSEDDSAGSESSEEESDVLTDISSFVLQEGGFVTADESLQALFAEDQSGPGEEVIGELENRLLEAAADRAEKVPVFDLMIPADAGAGLYGFLLNNNPQLFYIDGRSFSASVENGYVKDVNVAYHPEYGSADIELFNTRVSEIVSGPGSGLNDEQTALYLHDLLIVENTYDESLSKFNAYNALVEGSSGCQGYALAYKYLLNLAGIESDVISGSELSHAWNTVVIGGKTYYIDTAWDDPADSYLMHCGHRNFLLGREGMIETGHDAADWVNTKGENIFDAAAEEEYPDAWWRECTSRIPAVGDLWAYTVNGNEIFVHDYAGGSDRLLSNELGGEWSLPGSTENDSGYFISLDSYHDMFIASLQDSVYSITPAGLITEIGRITDQEMGTGRIYGIRVEGDSVRYDLYQSAGSPRLSYNYLPFSDENSFIHVAGITLDISQSRLAPGESVFLTAAVLPEDASERSVIWESSDPAVAAVDQSGRITAADTGTAVITVRSVSDPDICAEHRVTVAVKPESAAVLPESLTLSLYHAFMLSYTVLPENAEVVQAEWHSSDPQTASVDENGLVTAVNEGQAVITLDINGGEVSASVPVTVEYVPVSGIAIVNKKEYLPAGREEQIRYTVEPADASEPAVIFTSDRPEIVSVDDNGIMKGIADGTAVITVSDVNGVCSDSFTVEVISGSIYPGVMQKEYEYTGKAICPEVTLYDTGRLLKAGTDYTVSYKNNINAGTASAVLTMKGNYAGTRTINFEILPVRLEDDRITADALTVQETGKTLTPVPVLYFGAKKLAKTDYTVREYTKDGRKWDGKSAGEVTAILDGKGNYEGTRKVMIQVVPKDAQLTALSKLKVTAKSVKYQNIAGNDFAGEIIPNLTVRNGSKALVYEQDYIVSEIPADYRKTGTLKFTIEGIGKYSGKRTVSINITGIPLTDRKIKTAGIGTYVFNGQKQKLNEGFGLVYDGAELEAEDYEILEDSYQNNVNAGTASVIIEGRRGFTGTRTVKFTIRPNTESITAGDVAYEASVPVAKGGAKAQISIYDEELGLELVSGDDYTVKYSSNTKTGTGKAVLTFRGNFKGTPAQTVYFEITPKDIRETAVTVKDIVYSRAGKYKSTPSLKDTDGKPLKAGTDYSTDYSYELKDESGSYVPLDADDQVPAGSAVRVTVSGKGSYTGTVSGEYRILFPGTDISKAVFSIAPQEYTGKEIIPDGSAFTKAVINRTTQLRYGEDFEIVSCSGNIRKGTASVILHGINSYGGFKKVTFKITAKNLLPHWAEENEDEERKYAVVVSADASAQENFAAEVLSEYLTYLDGNDYPIIRDNQPFAGFRFCIGATSVYDTSDIAGKSADSYVLAPFRNGLAIYGAGSRGTVYGVFTFLEDFCGYRCFTWLSGMVKTSDKMNLPDKRIEYNTYFEYRNTDWRSGWTPLYSLANKLNGDLQGAVTAEQGGHIPYLSGSSHTLSNVFCSSDKYFSSHPEYFALHDGQRVPGQLCLTNDDVYRIVLDEVLELLAEEHNPNADLQIISLSQADNLDYCECDNCRSLDEANGSHAGSLLTFVNRIAGAVREKGYDNVAFDTFAYRYTRKAPSAVVPADNVIIRLCTFECCFSHAIDDPHCPENKELMKDLEEWSRICGRMYIWDYTTNYAFTLGIFPDFHVLQKNMQSFCEHGVRGVYEEGNYYIYLCDTEFADLRTYLIAKLLENPYCDYDAAMLDFCTYYYGAGGQYIKAAVDEITDHTKDHVTIYSSMTESFAIDEKEAEKIDQLWSRAENAAGSDEALEAIRRSKLSWRYLKACLGLREFSGTTEQTRNEREALHHDLIAHDVRMIDEWTYIEEDFAEYEMIPVEEWEYAGRFNYLRFDLMGGTGGPENQWFADEVWIPDTVPTRSGFQFLGWADSADAAVPVCQPGDIYSADTDITLYAVWG
ncbi:MAG: DUF4838 domain-containing protein [Solobacterium sp.]|nr:DUF4838 domain-containing protein [Solobacterium sp.]